MTTNDDMTPRQPDEGEPLEDLLGDEIDRVDQAVARITDAEVNERLRKALGQAGYTGQFPAQRPRLIEPSVMVDLICQTGPAMAPEHAAAADLLATARANAKLSWERAELSSQRLQQAEETLDTARQQAEQIVADAHEEADETLDEALKEAAKIVHAAREQAERIINDAHRKAAQGSAVVPVPNPNQPRVRVRNVYVDDSGEVTVSTPETRASCTRVRFESDLTAAYDSELESRWSPVPWEPERPLTQLPSYLVGGATPARQETEVGEGPFGPPVTRPGIIFVAMANDTPTKIDSGNWQPSPGVTPKSPDVAKPAEAAKTVWGFVASIGEARPWLPLAAVWDICQREDRGDGFVIVTPSEVPTAQVIDRLGISSD
jgi:vacuolar-type H+-ATPase subunit H